MASQTPARPETGPKTTEKQPEGGTGQPTAAETNAKLLESVLGTHIASAKRNGGDSTTDLSWKVADEAGIKKAGTTQAMATGLSEFLKHGDPSSPAGRKLISDFIRQLRAERDDHTADRTGAQEYFGKTGLPQSVQDQVRTTAQTMTDNAKKLLDPHTSEADKARILDQIAGSAQGGTGAAGIAALMSGGDQTSKDVRDMKSESGVILSDVAALRGANLTPQQRQALYQDIASKAGSLIPNELKDINNEGTEIRNDSAAIRLGAQLEAQLRAVMAHPGDTTTVAHIQSRLQVLLSTLGSVVQDRKGDEVKEPQYAAANATDTTIDKAIIEFTSPYKKKQ